MSDEIFENDEEIAGGEEPGKPKVGFLPGIVIQILKWVAIVLGAVIFIVTVVVITVSVLNKGNQAQAGAPISQAYEATPPEYDYFSSIGELRAPTADDTPHTVIVTPVLAYKQGDKNVLAELTQRKPMIQNTIIRYFFSKNASELEGKDNYQRVQNDLREEINRILASGKIQEVLFTAYNVVAF